MKRLKIPRPSDFHTHLRSIAQVGSRCFRWLVRMNCSHYRYVVVEPNTFLDADDPAHHIETVDDLVHYRDMVLDAIPEGCHCEPLFLIKLTPKTTPRIIDDAADAGCIGLKLYPEGVTVGSEHGGVSDFFSRQMYRCLERALERDLILQEHPEMPHTFCMQREWIYHQVLDHHARDFPGLRIFIEHVTDRRTIDLAVRLRQKYGAKIFVSITGHHLRMTLDDVLGRVDGHCWPCAKEPLDRDMLARAAMDGTDWIISITDSAPWKYKMKHLVERACAGIFNPAHIAIPNVVELFENRRGLGNLKPLIQFTSHNGLSAYGLKQDEDDTITLVRSPLTVPKRYDTGGGLITPFMAGKTIDWSIEGA
jgi:dihydroorotase